MYYCDFYDNEVDDKDCIDCEYKSIGKQGICYHAWVSPLWKRRCKAAEHLISVLYEGDIPQLGNWMSLVKEMGDELDGVTVVNLED